MKQLIFKLLFFNFILSGFSQPFSVGVNVPSLILLNLSLNSELPLKEKLSANLGLSVRPSLSFLSTGGSSLYFNLKGLSFTPELRYYRKSFSQNGIYFGPYLRFQKFSTGQFYHGMDYSSGLTADLYQGFHQTEYGIGFNIGYRFKLENFAFDFFVGPRYSRHKFELRVYHFPNETERTEEFDFEDLFQSSFPGIKKVYYKTTLYYDKITIPAILPALRLGFTVNYFFNINRSKKQNDVEIYYEDEEY